jgi:hypothetical protein
MLVVIVYQSLREGKTMTETMQKALELGISEELVTMPMEKFEVVALGVKVQIARHYAGQKLSTGEFFKLKHIEVMYNMRSWEEGDKQGPNRINRLAKKAAR